MMMMMMVLEVMMMMVPDAVEYHTNNLWYDSVFQQTINFQRVHDVGSIFVAFKVRNEHPANFLGTSFFRTVKFRLLECNLFQKKNTIQWTNFVNWIEFSLSWFVELDGIEKYSIKPCSVYCKKVFKNINNCVLCVANLLENRQQWWHWRREACDPDASATATAEVAKSSTASAMKELAGSLSISERGFILMNWIRLNTVIWKVNSIWRTVRFFFDEISALQNQITDFLYLGLFKSTSMNSSTFLLTFNWPSYWVQIR